MYLEMTVLPICTATEAVLAEWGSETGLVNKCLFSLYGQLRQVNATCVYTVLGTYS